MQIRRSKHVIRALGTKLVFALIFFFAASGAAFAKTSLSSGYEALSKEQRATLDELEQRTFEYFRDTANTAIGLEASYDWVKYTIDRPMMEAFDDLRGEDNTGIDLRRVKRMVIDGDKLIITTKPN